MEYIKHGLKHMQLEFYIEGSEPGLKGTVHVESKEVGFYISVAIFEYLPHWCLMSLSLLLKIATQIKLFLAMN